MWTFLWTGYATSPWTGQGILDGKISFFRQHLALGRTGRYSRSISASLACCSRADAFEHVLLRLLLRLVALAVYQLALERLEEGFRERVVPWVARPRHGSGDPMGLEAALERPGSVLGTLVIAEDEVEVVGRLSLLTACSSASATDFSVMRPDMTCPRPSCGTRRSRLRGRAILGPFRCRRCRPPIACCALRHRTPRPRGSRAGRPSRPNDLLYCIGLIPPNGSLILSSLYQRMYSSRASMKPWIDHPDQSRP